MAKLSPCKCRQCRGDVYSPRRTFCSRECVHLWRELHDWNYVRRRVRDRDKGVCAACGDDTKRMRDAIWLVRGCGAVEFIEMVKLTILSWGYDVSNLYGKDLWQADHIVARHLGGDNKLTNLRTLCVPCHKAVTARQAAARSADPVGAEA